MVEQRDRDHGSVEQSVADTLSGDILNLTGQRPCGAISIWPVLSSQGHPAHQLVDAVGGNSGRYTLIENDAGQSQHLHTGRRQRRASADEHVGAAGTVIQVGRADHSLSND